MDEDVDWAYFAGLLDADGSVSITRSTSRGKVYHAVRIVLTSGDKPTVDRLKLHLGGSTYIANRDAPTHHTTIWKWALAGKEAIEVLLETLPYLRIKKHRAKVALKFGATLDLPGGLTERHRAQRDKLYTEMKKLNRRGRLR